MDPDYLAFRELIRQAERDPAPAGERSRAVRAGRELPEVLALRWMCWVIQAALFLVECLAGPVSAAVKGQGAA